jgi:hypothetical protein
MPLFKKLTKVEEVDIDVDLAMPMSNVVDQEVKTQVLSLIFYTSSI